MIQDVTNQKDKKIEIVSLGCNCIPRTILTRNKIKPSKKEGELSCPFDLVVHEAKRLTHYLENDFENYFEDLYFEKYKKGWWDFRNKGIWKKTDGTCFFHDKDCSIHDREKLVGRVSRRINNLREILKSEKPILFVQYLMNDEDVENLYQLLKNIRGEKPFRLIIWDFNDILKKEFENIPVLKIPFPSEKYKKDWNRKKYFNSQIGLEFEKTIVEFVNQIINEMI